MGNQSMEETFEVGSMKNVITTLKDKQLSLSPSENIIFKNIVSDVEIFKDFCFFYPFCVWSFQDYFKETITTQTL